jgi:hypothetical protein
MYDRELAQEIIMYSAEPDPWDVFQPAGAQEIASRFIKQWVCSVLLALLPAAST